MPGTSCKQKEISIDKIRIMTEAIMLIVKLYHDFSSGGLKFFATSASV